MIPKFEVVSILGLKFQTNLVRIVQKWNHSVNCWQKIFNEKHSQENLLTLAINGGGCNLGPIILKGT